MAGDPHTDRLHVIERYTRKDLYTLHYEATIDDPGTYTEPWTIGFDILWDRSRRDSGIHLPGKQYLDASYAQRDQRSGREATIGNCRIAGLQDCRKEGYKDFFSAIHTSLSAILQFCNPAIQKGRLKVGKVFVAIVASLGIAALALQAQNAPAPQTPTADPVREQPESRVHPVPARSACRQGQRRQADGAGRRRQSGAVRSCHLEIWVRL